MSARYWRCKTCGLVWLYRPEASWSAGCPKCSNPMEPVEVWPEGTVARLREELQNIVKADWRTWPMDSRDPLEFVHWSKSRARAALAATGVEG